jgi:cytosine/creatinine deaminase
MLAATVRIAREEDVEQDWASMLAIAIREARNGLAEGGLPIGAAMFNAKGELLSSGHNRRVQQSDPSVHAETDAFRRAGRLRSYREVVMATTLAPCWYCSGLVRQFGIRTLVVGESRTFSGGLDWLRSAGVKVFDLDSQECSDMMQSYIRAHPEIWYEDIGEDSAPDA